jgi:hypothetical protein
VKDILTWTLDTIRSDSSMMSWMEERRYEWTPLIEKAIVQIINGASVVLVTDSKRRWLSKYILTTINDSSKNRPLFPIFELETTFPSFDKVFLDGVESIDDMYSLAFKENFLFWYIGISSHPNLSIAKSNSSSLLWVMDEELQNSFFLRSNDELIDIKLMQMVRLFDKTLDSALIGEIEI